MARQIKTYKYEAMTDLGELVFGEVQAKNSKKACAEVKKLGLWTTWVRVDRSSYHEPWFEMIIRQVLSIPKKIWRYLTCYTYPPRASSSQIPT